MTRQIVAGIDIGTSQIRVVIAERVLENGRVGAKIIGTGASEAKGVYRGYIADSNETAKSLAAAVARAEKMAGLKIKRVHVSFGGVGLGSIVSTGSVVISRADLEITEREISLALEAAEIAIPKEVILNKRIVNTAPIEFKIDGKVPLGDAVGLKGRKLEVRALFIICLERHLSDLIKTVEEAGIEVIDVVPAPLAASLVTLSKKQKRVGTVLADLGAETLSMVVYENNNLISLEVFPVGASDITNDIALGLKIAPDEAERLKTGDDRRISYSKKRLDEIVGKRLTQYFELIDAHLRSLGRHALLPAGIILIGGGASIPGIKGRAESILKLPSQLGEIHFGALPDGRTRDRSWATAVGLALIGFNTTDDERLLGRRGGSAIAESGKRSLRALGRLISQFLP